MITGVKCYPWVTHGFRFDICIYQIWGQSRLNLSRLRLYPISQEVLCVQLLQIDLIVHHVRVSVFYLVKETKIVRVAVSEELQSLCDESKLFTSCSMGRRLVFSAGTIRACCLIYPQLNETSVADLMTRLIQSVLQVLSCTGFVRAVHKHIWISTFRVNKKN